MERQEIEVDDNFLPPGWKVVTELVSGSTKFYRNVKTGQKSLVHPFLRRSQSVLKPTGNLSVLDQVTIRAENEFELGLVPDAVQVRLLRMSIPKKEEMILKFQQNSYPEVDDKIQNEADLVKKGHLLEELMQTERKYVEDMDLIIKKYLFV